MFRLFLFLSVMMVLAPTSRVAAQTPESEVRAAIDSLFSAIRVPNRDLTARLFRPEARLHSVVEANGRSVVQESPIQAFVDAVGSPRTEQWEEKIWDVEIRVDGGLATAWMQYAFQVDGVTSHCGVNAFQLVRGQTGWQILQVTDTRRTTGCVVGAE